MTLDECAMHYMTAALGQTFAETRLKGALEKHPDNVAFVALLAVGGYPITPCGIGNTGAALSAIKVVARCTILRLAYGQDSSRCQHQESQEHT